MKSLTLTPTNKPGTYSVCLSDGFSQKVIGSYNEASKTFTTHRKEAKHLHRNTNSLAINEAVLNELPGLKWVSIILEDKNGRKRELKTSKDYILKFGKRAAFASTGYEPQLFVKLDAFGMEKAIRFEQQIHSQGSLFPGVV